MIPFTPNTISSVEQLIGELSSIRMTGFAMDREEHEIGVACVAAPIFDHTGILAAISVSGPYERIMKSAQQLTKQATQIAGEISIFFGGMLKSNTPSTQTSIDFGNVA